MAHPLTVYRENKDLTLEEFGRLVDSTRGQVFKWEQGAVPRRRTLEKIFEVTGGVLSANDFAMPHGSMSTPLHMDAAS